MALTYSDLRRKFDADPFKPFRIHLSNSSTIEVCEPRPVIIGKLSAVIPIDTFVDERGRRIAHDWKTISISQIVECVDLRSKSHGKKCKRK